MGHVDPEILALMALGEPVGTREQHAHVDGCELCAADLAGLSRAARAGRASIEVGDLEEPRPAVWDRIAGELLLESSPAPASSPPTDHAPRSDVAPRRRRWAKGWVLAAAVTVIAGAGIGAWAYTSATSPAEVADASLIAFPDHPEAAGTALVEQEPDGSRTVHVELTADAAAPDTYREVWLLTSDASELVSLGVVEDGTAVLAIPDGVDLADFPLVDVSEEPVDGDPGHSGDSIVRGPLTLR